MNDRSFQPVRREALGKLSAIVGGLSLGVLELLSSFLFSFSYRDAIAMLALFVVLIVRPQGIAGKRMADRI